MEVKRDSKNRGPYIITICGSLRFTKEMLIVHKDLSEQGFMVFLPNINPFEIPEGSSPANEDDQKLHDAKIEFGDAIFICNFGGYIGESTYHEFKLARKMKKDIFWAESKNEEAMEKTRKLLMKFDRKEKRDDNRRSS